MRCATGCAVGNRDNSDRRGPVVFAKGERVMRKFVVLASCVMLAAVAAGCAGPSSSDSLLAPGGGDSLSANGKGRKPSGGGGGTTGGGSSSLELRMVTDNGGDGGPNWGDVVTFNISTTATTEPNVSLTCSQNGVVVYGAVAGFYASYPWPWTQIMTLSSNSWTGGGADCVAKLYYISGTSTVDLTSKNITVAP